MRRRYRVVVVIARGEHMTRYDATSDPVRPGKAARVLAEAVDALAEHIGRGHPVIIHDYARGSTLRSGTVRASVRLRLHRADLSDRHVAVAPLTGPGAGLIIGGTPTQKRRENG